MSFKDLTVVGVLNPRRPRKGQKIIEIFPEKQYLEGFVDKEIFFAETKLSTREFISFFEEQDMGGQKLGVYMTTLNSDCIFKENLFKESNFVLREIRYDENYKRILNLENILTQNEFTQDRVNHLRAQILYAQTFEQAGYLLHEGSLFNPANKVLYVNFVAGYAIHLMTGCKFLEDVPADFETDKLKADLALIYKAFKLDSVWEFDQKPNISGSWGKDNNFKLFYFFPDENLANIEGFISDAVGLQYFTGVFEDKGLCISINTRYFTNMGMLPSRWHLVNCFSPKEMSFCFETKWGYFQTKNGRKNNFLFNKKLFN